MPTIPKKFHLVRFHANRAIYALEHNTVRQDRRLQMTKKLLQDSIKHPTSGRMAFWEALKNVKDTYTYSKNANNIDFHSDIAPLRRSFKHKVTQKLYPKTFIAREFIIKTQRIAFDKTNSVKHDLKRFLFKYFGL